MRRAQVSIGDVLHEIDGHHVYRKPVAQLAPLILGHEGTVVRLGVQRGNLQRLVYVELRRGWSMTVVKDVAGGAAGGAPGAGSLKTWSHPVANHFSLASKSPRLLNIHDTGMSFSADWPKMIQLPQGARLSHFSGPDGALQQQPQNRQ